MSKDSANCRSSSRSKIALIIFTLFLGSLGVHRMYAGKIRSGILIFIISISNFTIHFIYRQEPIKNIFFLLINIADIILSVLVLSDFFRAIFGIFKDDEGLKIDLN
jgi:TM2 domain-containing membrane protein YozV